MQHTVVTKYFKIKGAQKYNFPFLTKLQPHQLQLKYNSHIYKFNPNYHNLGFPFSNPQIINCMIPISYSSSSPVCSPPPQSPLAAAGNVVADCPSSFLLRRRQPIGISRYIYGSYLLLCIILA